MNCCFLPYSACRATVYTLPRTKSPAPPERRPRHCSAVCVCCCCRCHCCCCCTWYTVQHTPNQQQRVHARLWPVSTHLPGRVKLDTCVVVVAAVAAAVELLGLCYITLYLPDLCLDCEPLCRFGASTVPIHVPVLTNRTRLALPLTCNHHTSTH